MSSCFCEFCAKAGPLNPKVQAISEAAATSNNSLKAINGFLLRLG